MTETLKSDRINNVRVQRKTGLPVGGFLLCPEDRTGAVTKTKNVFGAFNMSEKKMWLSRS